MIDGLDSGRWEHPDRLAIMGIVDRFQFEQDAVFQAPTVNMKAERKRQTFLMRLDTDQRER